jgi:hypothetical protein
MLTPAAEQIPGPKSAEYYSICRTEGLSASARVPSDI